MSQAKFRKATLVVLAGSLTGFGINLLLTPVISRIFDPETFGISATVIAAASVFVGISTFRLEVYSQRTADREDARAALTLGLTATLLWGLVVTIAGAIAVYLWDVPIRWLATGGLLAVASLQLLGSATLTRQGRYRNLAVSNGVQGAGAGLLQVLLGYWSASVWSLLAGFAVARLIWVRSISWSIPPLDTLRRALRKSYRFGLTAGPSAGINSLASQLPILLVLPIFGTQQTGQLAMAIRILVGPLSIVGQAAAAASIGEVGRSLRVKSLNAKRTVLKGMGDLAFVGVVPCALAAALGTWAVPLVLGSEWRQAGVVLALLSIGGFAQFVAAPFSQVLNLTGHNRALLAWDSGRFVLILGGIIIPASAGQSFELTIFSYSMCMLAIYVILGYLVLRSVRAR